MKSPAHILIVAVFCMLASILASSCRDVELLYVDDSETIAATASSSSSSYQGLYLLNEGNMGSNKCTIDYLDFTTSTYSRNIYPARNPSVVMELGDVGNDLQVYGHRLYAVINCSNKVEVMNAHTATRIGQVDIPNCRNICFHGSHAYVSSYVSSVYTTESVLGSVYKVDTASLSIESQVTVGYQPEELVIADSLLIVANSGGYMSPDYDNTLSVISLSSFTELYKIPVAPNLHHLRLDDHGRLWISSRGNYDDISSNVYVLEPPFLESSTPTPLNLPCSNMAIHGDSLFLLASDSDSPSFSIVDITPGGTVGSSTVLDISSDITTPYGVAVHPETGDIFITDAKNYVSSGNLLCYDRYGSLQWSVKTGDIPAHLCFVSSALSGGSTEEASTISVIEFMPAPGQFINLLPLYDEGDTEEDIIAKANESLASSSLISLGGFGGYITLCFDHRVQNIEGEMDFLIQGNALLSTLSDGRQGGSSEPGVVMVSVDENANGLPDDTWYELAGSAYDISTHNYSISYTLNPDASITWEDNQGDQGTVETNSYHTQSYFPSWLPDSTITFSGTLLPSNAELIDGTYVLFPFDYGYADNYPNSNTTGISFNIDWAVDSLGNTVSLPGADFIRVYTAMRQTCGWLGETSTEICGVEDLHYSNTP